MADFIAVIRRAVDGLSNNTPEMRAKVYEKARSAVLRQLENMSPRPPEDMIRRQMDKLTAAIEEVEAEHAVALPVDDEPVYEAPAYQEPVYSEPEPAPTAPAPVAQDAFAGYQPAAAETAEPRVPTTASAEIRWPVADEDEQPTVVDSRHARADFATADDWTSQGTQEPVAAEPTPPPAEEPLPEPETVAAEAPDLLAVDAQGDDDRFRAPIGFDRPVAAAEPSAFTPADVLPAAYEEPLHADVAAEPVDISVTPASPAAGNPFAQESWSGFSANDSAKVSVSSAEADLGWPETEPRDKDAARDDFDNFVGSYKPSETPAMPEAVDLLDWHGELAKLPPLAGSPAGSPVSSPERLEPLARPVPTNPSIAESFDDLLGDGYEPSQKRPAPVQTGDIDEFLASAQQTAYRKEAKPRRNFVPLVLALAGVILVGGAGYALWSNKDAVSAMVADLTGSLSDATGDSAPATPDASSQQASAPPPAASQPVAAPTGAPEEGVATVQKFTQRLQANGTEIDEGAAGANGASGEGRSVAQQTVAPTEQPGPTPSAPNASAATPPGAPVATGALPTGSQERAFLYEERLGQASPTAIVGGIEWTVLRETGADGRPDPAIQGKLNIPERGLNALITFRRNNDSSLPASHLIEIVFSMPADFEGGAVDAVQRVAMKRTEQDRGDPVVGVSAKVTDDTFLIALNDFPDVVARNLDLLTTRSWIDIPVTYRNGRRALLTVDKGANGAALFQQVLREWAALRPAVPAN